MNPMKLPFALMIALLALPASSAFAQKKKRGEDSAQTTPTPTATPVPTLIDKALNDIQLDFVALEARKKSLLENYSVCGADLLNMQKKYLNWFVEHAPELKVLEAEIARALEQKNERIQSTLAEKGATGLTVGEIYLYLNRYFQEYYKLPAGQKALFVSQQEDPDWNFAHHPHSKLLADFNLLVGRFNQLSSDDQLKLVLQESTFALTFESSFSLQGKTIVLKKSVLSVQDFLLNPLDGWKAAVQGDLTIAQMPVDAVKRYAVFQSLISESCKNEVTHHLESLFCSQPWLKLDSVVTFKTATQLKGAVITSRKPRNLDEFLGSSSVTFRFNTLLEKGTKHAAAKAEGCSISSSQDIRPDSVAVLEKIEISTNKPTNPKDIQSSNVEFRGSGIVIRCNWLRIFRDVTESLAPFGVELVGME